jgi:putative PEP-CTERM system histidine kinase
MYKFGVISYLLGGLLFLALSSLLVTSWRGRLRGMLLLTACAVNALWCFVFAYATLNARLPNLLTFVAEVLRDTAWILFLLHFLYGVDGKTSSRKLTFTINALLIGVFLYGLVLGAAYWGTLAFDSTSDKQTLRYVVLALAALLALSLLAQIYRNSRQEQLWAIKHFYIGVGGLLAYDLYMYSLALLFGQVSEDLWNARGIVNMLAVPLIALSAVRIPSWSTEIFVSRHVVLHTVTLVASGIYLLSMAAAGYYISHFGGPWGPELQISFLFGALMLLFVIIVSSQMRARVRVFIGKHFYRNKYDYRQEWLRLIHSLTTQEDELPLPERAIRAVAQIVDSPGGVLWQRRGGGDLDVSATWNMLPPKDTKIAQSSTFMAFFDAHDWVIELDYLDEDSSKFRGINCPKWVGKTPHAWLLVPLILKDRLYGLIVLAKSRAPFELDWEDYDLLKTVGRQVAIHLAESYAVKALDEARQFEAYNRLSAYVMHDLKNVTAQLSLISTNAKKHRGNPAFMDDVFGTVENSITRMNRLITQLRQGRETREQTQFSLIELMFEVVEKWSTGYPAPKFSCMENNLDVVADRDKLLAVLGNMVQNAQQATQKDGSVKVSIHRDSNKAFVTIQDDGHGMEEVFIKERLFRPFETTKGAKGMGIGLFEAREYIKALDGDIRVDSKPGIGTTFCVVLPLTGSSLSRKMRYAGEHA